MPFEMFQAGETSIAGGADMWPWLIRLRRRKIRVDAILRTA